MKHAISRILGLAALCAGVSLAAQAANPSAGYIDFGKFSPPGSGGEFVEVHIRTNLINMVARLAEKAEPKAAEVLRGLKLIRVNVIGITDANRAEIEKRVKSIREQLDTQGWERIVTAQKDNEDVSVYMKTRGDEAVEGLVVTVIQGGKEAVLVNIVGDIRPDKIATLAEQFNIEPLKKVGEAMEKK